MLEPGGPPTYTDRVPMIRARPSPPPEPDLDAALDELAALDERQARLVEMRFFGGLSVEESARALGISLATAGREWVTAKAWLFRKLKTSPPRE